MDDAIDPQYFTYEGRLGSFAKSKKRGSTTGGRGGKTLNWPHKSILPEHLAKAGFIFNPSPENPDNVLCFICHKSMDGWEAGDIPLTEHLDHAEDCGWATMAAIEAEIRDYAVQNPNSPEMIDARKATFAGRWPHESKRAWKCKTKQMVEAGWVYAPTLESDDMAFCPHCKLGLDGWEKEDKPWDEHFDRVPNCQFFALFEQYGPPKKRGARPKNSRTSKASRLSTQSVAPSEATTLDMTTTTMGPDDTVMTSTSTATANTKKGGAKKKTAAKAKKAKGKKDEPAPEQDPEVQEPESAAEQDPMEQAPEPTPKAKPAPRLKRGKKRGSEAVEESTITTIEAPATKRRDTRSREESFDSFMTAAEDTQASVASTVRTSNPKKGRTSNARKSTRKASSASRASNLSIASTAVPSEEFPDDDEIERQLQADLDRFSDDEILADSDSERRRSQPSIGADNVQKQGSADLKQAHSKDFAMFDPQPLETDDEAVEQELASLQQEMAVDEPEEPLVVPKKGRKVAAPRKASKQTKTKKTKASKVAAAEPEIVTEPAIAAEAVDEELADEVNASIGSTDTVVKTVEPETGAESEFEEEVQPKPKRTLGKASKSSVPRTLDEIEEEEKAQEETAKRNKASKAGLPKDLVEDVEEPIPVKQRPQPEEPPKRKRGRPKASTNTKPSANDRSSQATQAPAKVDKVKKPKAEPKKRTTSAETTAEPVKIHEDEQTEDELADDAPAARQSVEPTRQRLARVPNTPPRNAVSSVVRQAGLSPSQSPQVSDAENVPPSSIPQSSQKNRVPLAPITATPRFTSPSKRNVVAGLQSSIPWSTVDLDVILGTPKSVRVDKENGFERLLRKGKELTTPEKGMTVEEWIRFNAGQAEKELKEECEAMVSRFESEGGRAMRVLEGLDVIE